MLNPQYKPKIIALQKEIKELQVDIKKLKPSKHALEVITKRLREEMMKDNRNGIAQKRWLESWLKSNETQSQIELKELEIKGKQSLLSLYKAAAKGDTNAILDKIDGSLNKKLQRISKAEIEKIETNQYEIKELQKVNAQILSEIEEFKMINTSIEQTELKQLIKSNNSCITFRELQIKDITDKTYPNQTLEYIKQTIKNSSEVSGSYLIPEIVETKKDVTHEERAEKNKTILEKIREVKSKEFLDHLDNFLANIVVSHSDNYKDVIFKLLSNGKAFRFLKENAIKIKQYATDCGNILYLEICDIESDEKDENLVKTTWHYFININSTHYFSVESTTYISYRDDFFIPDETYEDIFGSDDIPYNDDYDGDQQSIDYWNQF